MGPKPDSVLFTLVKWLTGLWYNNLLLRTIFYWISFHSSAFQYGLRVLCSHVPLQTIFCNGDSSIEIQQSFYGVSSAYDTCNNKDNLPNVTCYTDVTHQVAKM